MTRDTLIRNLQDRAVLITGGTRGIGLACALAFARHGASCILTYRWGSDDEDEIRSRFEQIGATPPLLIQADVSQTGDTDALMEEIAGRFDNVDVFISNATGAVLVNDLEDLTERGLLKTMKYSAWPTVDYILKMKHYLGAYPKYAVAISSTGPDEFSINYDLMAASKAAQESLCRYLSYRLRNEQICINVLRTAGIRTDAFDKTFGREFSQFLSRLMPESRLVTAEEVANAALALCSGMLDGVRGQVITIDHGCVFADNLSRLFQEREELGL